MALTEANKKLPQEISESPEHIESIRRIRIKYLSLVSLCAFLSATFAILECFAAFNIEYCAGEDLMNLYWGFWSILQVGSNIAIVGIMLQFWIILGDVETPSWAVAMGTPVLVFAALGFVLKEVWKKTWARLFNKSHSQKEDDTHTTTMSPQEIEEKTVGSPVSQASTIIPLSASVKKRNSFWSRDLHYLMSSIITENHAPHHERLDQILEESSSSHEYVGPRELVRKKHTTSRF